MYVNNVYDCLYNSSCDKYSCDSNFYHELASRFNSTRYVIETIYLDPFQLSLAICLPCLRSEIRFF